MLKRMTNYRGNFLTEPVRKSFKKQFLDFLLSNNHLYFHAKVDLDIVAANLKNFQFYDKFTCRY